MRSKAGSNVLAETASMRKGLDPSTAQDAGNRTLCNSRLFPMFSVRMTPRGNNSGSHAHGRQHPREYESSTHTHTCAIGWPNQRNQCIARFRAGEVYANERAAGASGFNQSK